MAGQTSTPGKLGDSLLVERMRQARIPGAVTLATSAKDLGVIKPTPLLPVFRRTARESRGARALYGCWPASNSVVGRGWPEPNVHRGALNLDDK